MTDLPDPTEFPARRGPTYVVGIGASAGGLEALERFFSNAPPNTGMAFVVVQHLSPDFKSLMNELLDRWTTMAIHRVENGMRIDPDAIYLIPPKKDMIVANGQLMLTDRDPAEIPSLPIDRFFRSLATDAGDRAIGIVLSGTGSDGSQGVRYIRESGGLVIVQSAETAKFDGMPNSAIKTGSADLILPPEEIPAALLRYASRTSRSEFNLQETPPSDRGWEALFRLLRERFAVDFSVYRSGTIVRRTERRMMMASVQDLDEYVKRLVSDPDEANNLYRDLLIGVTRFFRDPEAFARIEADVIPALLDRVTEGGELRVWVAGCATGEEAYSLGILFQERLAASRGAGSVKIFATDIHKLSLEVASTGLYHEAALAELSPERVARFFMRKGENYQVSPELRGMVVFAQHNLIKDAPFTKMDLITCRNMLIYLQPAAQKKVLSLFHFALKTGQFLFLGPSEGPGDLGDEFDTVDHRWKIFTKRRNVRVSNDFRLLPMGGLPLPRVPGPPVLPAAPDTQLIGVYDGLLERYMPSGLLINEHRELVQSFGGAGKFLRIRDGRHTTDVLEMVDGDLRMALSGAMQRASKEVKPVSYKALRLGNDEGAPVVNLIVQPIHNRRTGSTYQMVTFEDIGTSPQAISATELSLHQASHDQLHTLETELRYTRENLQATIEELETSNEELQATNEELVASNEELQSTNEELHSVNEELYTVNAEYQRKIGELTELTADMENLMAATQVYTLFLDRNLCIRKFTPLMQTVFNLLPQDVGRRIETFTHAIDHPTLFDEIRRVLDTGETAEAQVRDRVGQSFLLRVLPYRANGLTAGVVLTLVNIERLVRAEAERRRTDIHLHSILDNTPNFVFLKDLEGRYVLANEAFRRVCGVRDVIGLTATQVFPESAAARAEQHRRILECGRAEQVHEVYHQEDGPHHYLSIKFPIFDESGAATGLGCIGTDVTALKRAEAEAHESVAQRDRFLAMLSHELRNPLAAILNAVRLIRRQDADPRVTGDWLPVIERRATHMSRLLDDLLDIARLAQNKIEIRSRRFDLRDTLIDAREEVRAVLEDRGLSLTVDAPPDTPLWINGDPDRIQQVQVNLLVNAAKYTPRSGHVWLRLELEGGSAVIRVRDDGIGIAPEMLARVFELFVQGSAPVNAASEGIGVGLTLVRAIVDLHGGRVSAHSAGVGKGAEFVVRLPLAEGGAVESAAEPATEPALAPGRRVLVVDDDPDNCRLICDTLMLDGHVVDSASTATEALSQLSAFRPDVAFLDIGLPDINGFELARLIRATEPGRKLLLVALSGYGRREDREAGRAAGFDAYLVKPLNPADLERLLG